MKHLTIIVTLLISVTFLGCSSGTVVTGTVKYADGSPVTAGSVMFDNGKLCFPGMINADGGYTTGLNGAKGIPQGNYRVYLQGMTETEFIPTGRMVQNTDGTTGEENAIRMVYRVAEKYCSPETSGLTFEVDGKTKTLDITVEKP